MDARLSRSAVTACVPQADDRGPFVVLGAAKLGTTRLIDNVDARG